MSTERLIEEIRAAPRADGPRLAYADLLEEQGEVARAAFIRTQCELSREAEPNRREALEQQAQELRREHEAAWLADWRDALEDWRWERGFLETVGFRLERAGEILPRLLAREPVTRIDAAEDTADDAEALAGFADCPELERIGTLDLSEAELGAAGMRVVLGSPHLTALEQLAISDQDSTPAVAEAVAEVLPRSVKTLRFMGYLSSTLGDDGAALLAGSPALVGLRHLDLINALIGPRGAQALAGSPNLATLRRLNLGGGNYSVNRIGPEGARALGASSALGNLTHLWLDYNDIGDEGLKALAASRHWRQLESLVLIANEITDDGFKFLAVSDVLDSVVALDLGHNRITAHGLGSLLRAAPPKLARLWLRGNPLEGRGVRTLAGAPMAARLEALSIAYTRADDASAQALVSSPYLRSSLELYAQGNSLGDATGAALRRRFERVRL